MMAKPIQDPTCGESHMRASPTLGAIFSEGDGNRPPVLEQPGVMGGLHGEATSLTTAHPRPLKGYSLPRQMLKFKLQKQLQSQAPRPPPKLALPRGLQAQGRPSPRRCSWGRTPAGRAR